MSILLLNKEKDMTSFSAVKQAQKELGFKKEIQFFNSGIERDWKKLLSDKIVNKIHPIEKDLLKEFLVSYIMSGKDN